MKTRQKIFILAQKLARKGETADWSKLVAQLDRYRDKLHEAWQAGTDELTIQLPPRWTIWGSIYYCFTLFSTIGYGDIFPSTYLGRLFTMVYGMATIPMCSLLVSRMSSFIVRFSKAIYIMTLEQSRVPTGLRDAYSRTDRSFNFRVFPCLLVLVVYIMIGGAIHAYMASSKRFRLSPTDAVYFAFITITTVGFGDIAPDVDTSFTVISVAYILFGLALTGIVFGQITMALDRFLLRFASTTIKEDPKTTDQHGATRGASVHHQKHA